MALIRCPECRKKYSDKATACPGCGAPVALAIQAEQDEKKKRQKGLLIIGGFILLWALFSGSKDDKPSAPAQATPTSQPAALIDVPPAPDSPPAKPVEPEPPKPQWRYQSEKDDMRGVTNRWATLVSENRVSLEFPYNGGSNLRIVVRSMPKKYGQDVYLEISSGQLDCGFDGCRVPVKFDDGPIIKYTATRADGGNTDTVFIREQSGFLKRIKKSKTVTVEVPIWRRGSTQFQFSSAGLEWK